MSSVWVSLQLRFLRTDTSSLAVVTIDAED
jgi:hypothetical protein